MTLPKLIGATSSLTEPDPCEPKAHGSAHHPLTLPDFGGDKLRSAEAPVPVETRKLRIEFASIRHPHPLAEGDVVTVNDSGSMPHSVELFLEDRLIARGTLVTSEGRLGVRIDELVEQSLAREAA